ncbi:hypothetical protein FK529_07760 [Tsukamurella asaccharolytica]|uniref:EcsC family protein n=1 Tax=Tsukamurella asaccharolytica TaxID=2592067 RepID=A0A5C5RA86_9ACTN|nr:EcsC family protein [Tsukamurella asaccharolytica]TWS20029.1 hypothetical protein FK529_07760 [Tsukamurella asaccharolytica]
MSDRSKSVDQEDSSSQAMALVNKILTFAVTGGGPIKPAAEVAEEALRTHGDPEVAIDRLLGTHRRIVTATGFASGFGGLPTMAVAIPTDITVFYMNAARLSAAVAHIRGYDIESEEVRSAILISLLGASAGGILGSAGAQIGNKIAVAQLKRLPGTVLTQINKAVGFRLLTKFGTKGSINLVKVVPVVGGGVGAGFNAITITQIHKYSKKLFVPLEEQRDGDEHGVGQD